MKKHSTTDKEKRIKKKDQSPNKRQHPKAQNTQWGRNFIYIACLFHVSP
jgi:hypothetical protein